MSNWKAEKFVEYVRLAEERKGHSGFKVQVKPTAGGDKVIVASTDPEGHDQILVVPVAYASVEGAKRLAAVTSK